MKEEDADWLIYHLIAQKTEVTAGELADESNLDAVTVAASLDRLDHNLLIDKTGAKVRLLSIGESLIKCQAKYDNALPYVIENGVIKARKK
ncbi:MAG: MarR family transcriptional regulator [Methanoregula sp.]